ncbi:MAG: ATPase, partial [Candidatus Rifleibacteriota bacterium]
MASLFDKAKEFFQKVPASPTNPQKPRPEAEFKIEDLFDSEQTTTDAAAGGLDEKLRQAYFWITNTASISPFYDIEYNEDPPRTFLFGDRRVHLSLPTGQSYS